MISNAAGNTLTEGARRYAMVILAVVYMFNFIDRQILAILLPAISDEFQVSDKWLGFLIGPTFAIFYVTLGIPIARYADRANRRNLLAAAVAIWSGMTALSGMAQNFWHLVLARIGVGVGEAGCSPPAHSMIADYYPPEQRTTAMGFYTLGISSGIMVAYVAGGWFAESYGWRNTLFIVGIPGLILALIVRFTVVEPERGASERRQDSGSQPTLREVLRFLATRHSFMHMGIAAGLSSFVGYSVVNFMPIFLVRSFDMGLANLGVWLGLIMGFAGGAGYFGGGLLADFLGNQKRSRSLNFLALATVPALLSYAVVFLAPSAQLALSMMFLPTILSNFYLPTVLAQSQSLVSLRMRALTSALVLLIINIIGLACGPFLTGVLSDALNPTYGADSMRYSLLIVCAVLLPWSAFHFWRAGRTIDGDLVRATEHD